MQPPDEKNEIMPLLKASIPVVLLFQTCALFARSFTYLQFQEGGMEHLFAKDLSWLLVPTILGFLMTPILQKSWRILKTQFLFRDLTIRLVIVSVTLGIALRLAQWGGLIANASFQIFTRASENSIVGPVIGFECPSSGTLALTILVSTILTPLLEETINRGYILQSLLPRGRWIAIAGSAILFGIFHRPTVIVPAMIIGIFFALQYLNTRTLWASVITHSTYNALVILDWECAQVIWNPVGVTSVSKAIGILSIVVVLLALLLALLLTQRNLYMARPGRNAPRP